MGAKQPYSHGVTWAGLDGRSKEARLLRGVRSDLVAHVGGKPSATQRALIERAATLTLHVALLDERVLRDGSMSDHAGRQYLSWSNSLTRTLRQLGLKGAASEPPRLSDYTAARAAGRAA